MGYSVAMCQRWIKWITLPTHSQRGSVAKTDKLTTCKTITKARVFHFFIRKSINHKAVNLYSSSLSFHWPFSFIFMLTGFICWQPSGLIYQSLLIAAYPTQGKWELSQQESLTKQFIFRAGNCLIIHYASREVRCNAVIRNLEIFYVKALNIQ